MTRQVAALPYRIDAAGGVEVLITSRRDGQRWLPPKANLIDGLTPHEAAAQEAVEEAGVIGRISPRPFGGNQAVKWRTDRLRRAVNVTLFPMCFESRAVDWPEKGQRSVLWFEPSDTAHVVRARELDHLIAHFDPTRPSEAS